MTVLRDRKYLDYLRSQPCIFTGMRGSDPMHIGTAGKAVKSPDNEALPVLHEIHSEAHQRGEMTVIRENMPDWLLREMLRCYARAEYEKWKKYE